MHPLAERLATGFIRHFSSADQQIQWKATEQERLLWLSQSVALVGRVDALGLTADGDPFFGEWKTLSNYRGRYIDDEKMKWRTDPQALTYGVLLASDANRFTVRWAIKPPTEGKRASDPPTYDFEWYTYTATEIDHWRTQLLQIAEDISITRLLRKPTQPWLTNFGNCYQYGVKHVCPFFDDCSHQRWGGDNANPRIPHLALEQPGGPLALADRPSTVVVLDASRIGDYLDCPQKYRRKWEGSGYTETSEALTIGTDFHHIISNHIRSIIGGTKAVPMGTKAVPINQMI